MSRAIGLSVQMTSNVITWRSECLFPATFIFLWETTKQITVLVSLEDPQASWNKGGNLSISLYGWKPYDQGPWHQSGGKHIILGMIMDVRVQLSVTALAQFCELWDAASRMCLGQCTFPGASQIWSFRASLFDLFSRVACSEEEMLDFWWLSSANLTAPYACNLHSRLIACSSLLYGRLVEFNTIVTTGMRQVGRSFGDLPLPSLPAPYP
jgi:hypothetical protein